MSDEEVVAELMGMLDTMARLFRAGIVAPSLNVTPRQGRAIMRAVDRLTPRPAPTTERDG